MRVFGRLFLVTLIFLSAPVCIRHYIENDYPRYLSKNAGESNLPKTDKASEYYLTPETEEHRYEFRSQLSGAANLWIVEFGKMLDDTLMSADVQNAFGALRKVPNPSAATNNLLIFDLQNYTFNDFSAHVSLKISHFRAGQEVFANTYVRDGKSQGGKMFWGGASAQKNAVQQSTKIAVDGILRQLIADLNAR